MAVSDIGCRLLIPVQTLVEKLGPEILCATDDQGHTAAHYACIGGHKTILKFIIDSRGSFDEPSHDEVGQHPIHWACVQGHIDVVDLLLQVSLHSALCYQCAFRVLHHLLFSLCATRFVCRTLLNHALSRQEVQN